MQMTSSQPMFIFHKVLVLYENPIYHSFMTGELHKEYIKQKRQQQQQHQSVTMSKSILLTCSVIHPINT